MKNLSLALLLLAIAVPAIAGQKKPKGKLRANATAHSVTLTWVASTFPTGSTPPAGDAVAGYTVLRAATCAGPFAAITTALVTAVTYIDTNVSAGQTVCYEVTASDNQTPVNVSGPSNTASATIPSPPPAPNAPTGLTVTSVN